MQVITELVWVYACCFSNTINNEQSLGCSYKVYQFESHDIESNFILGSRSLVFKIFLAGLPGLCEGVENLTD